MFPDSTLAVLLSPPVLGVLGLLIGSFLNVVIHRLPMMEMRDWWAFDIGDYALSDARSWRAVFGAKAVPPAAFGPASQAIAKAMEGLPPQSLLRPRSRCPECGHVLRWYENIPVFSWLALRGRCSACKTPISWRYPLVEAATAVMFAACAALFGATAHTVVACTAVALLLAMALIDLRTTLLPDRLTVPLIGLAMLASLAGWSGVTVQDAAIGALLGYGLLWLPGFIWKVVLGKPNAMAEGDMKMLCGLGALLGWKMVPGMLLLAAGAGAVIGVVLILFGGHKRETPIPFGPYLALAGLGGLFFGDTVAGFGDALQPLLR